jgi:hypothetical protein
MFVKLNEMYYRALWQPCRVGNVVVPTTFLIMRKVGKKRTLPTLPDYRALWQPCRVGNVVVPTTFLIMRKVGKKRTLPTLPD